MTVLDRRGRDLAYGDQFRLENGSSSEHVREGIN